MLLLGSSFLGSGSVLGVVSTRWKGNHVQGGTDDVNFVD